MPLKSNLVNLARKAKSAGENYQRARNFGAAGSEKFDKAADKVVGASQGVIFVATHWKELLIALIVIIIVTIVGVSGSMATSTVMNARTLNDCNEGISKSDIQKQLEGSGIVLSEQDKKDLDSATANATCKKQGSGYTGEAFPPTTGTVTALFNEYRTDPPRYHAGMDIASACGTPIYAFSGGTVEKVVLGTEAASGSGGYAYPMGDIVIKHTDTFKTRYLHMNGASVTVKVGDVVSAGQQIAAQWTNGPSTGCHLHIEAYVDNQLTDMMNFLQECGFNYVYQQSFNTLPEAPVMCGEGQGGAAGGDVKVFAKQYMQSLMGISSSSADGEFQCLNNLWERESNWRVTAQNNAFAPSDPHTPHYQAYGIAQAAPGSKMASEGADWQTNPQTQVKWGLKYIQGRYGTPCGAWAHSEAYNWY